MKEEDPAIIKQLLGACYSCDYDDTAGDDYAMCFNARKYAAAEKYQVPFLKDLAMNKFETQLKVSSNIPPLLEVINIIYTTTLSLDRWLRGLVAPLLHAYG